MNSFKNKITCKAWRLVFALLAVSVLVSCGGGGGGVSNTPTQTDPSAFAVTIGPAGGIATTGNGVVEIQVPPGVLSKNTTFTASPTINQVSTDQVLGNAFDFGPDGATFTQPIALQFTVSMTDLPEGWSLSPYGISYWSNGSWIEVPSNISDDNRTISANISHFSTYAVTKRISPSITSPDHTWSLSSSGCLTATGQGDSLYNESLGLLGQSLFGLSAIPTDGTGCVTNPFLADHYSYYFKSLENHAGIDFRAAPGTPVFAPLDGEVVWTQLDPAAGKSTLTIKSTVGGNDFLLMYLHCQTHILKRQGQTLWQLNYADTDPAKRQIQKGDQVCQSGSVGADAPHLHFEVRLVGSDAGNLLAMSGSRGVCVNLEFQGYNPNSGQYDLLTSPGCPLTAIRAQDVDPANLYSLLPTAPTGVSATAGDGQATISWNAVAGVTNNLYVASVSGVTKNNYSSLADGLKLVGVISPFIQTSLTNGKQYYFVVTAVDANGESVESSQVSATPQASTLPLLIQDDFNDGVINSIWITNGTSVLESGGILSIQENVTDTYASAKVNIATSSKIRLEMSHYLHAADPYFMPGIYFADQSGSGFWFYWMYSSYGPDYCNDSNGYNMVMVKYSDADTLTTQCLNSTLLSSNYFDKWVTSVISYDQGTGQIDYDVDGDGTIDFTATLPVNNRKQVSSLTISGYGWYTGHYFDIDWINIYGD